MRLYIKDNINGICGNADIYRIKTLKIKIIKIKIEIKWLKILIKIRLKRG